MMKRVDLLLPYERQRDPKQPNKEMLVLSGLVWPQNCPCCMQPTGEGVHPLEHRVEMMDKKEAVIRWQVPYCDTCQAHARVVAPLVTGSLVFGLVLYVAIGYVLFINGLVEDNALGYGIAFGLVALVAAITYGVFRLARKLLSENRMKAECSTHSWAVSVPRHMFLEGDQMQLMFVFTNDDYAEEFAAQNAGHRPG